MEFIERLIIKKREIIKMIFRFIFVKLNLFRLSKCEIRARFGEVKIYSRLSILH